MGKTLKGIAGTAFSIRSLYMGAGGFTSMFGVGLGLMGLNALLSSTQRSEGAKLEDLGVQLAQEGASLPRGWGVWRQGSTLVWSTGLITHTATSRQGKGGPKHTEYSYSTSLALLGGRGPITRPFKIELNGVVKYDYNNGNKKGATLAYDAANGMWYSTSIEDDWCSAIRIYDGTQSQVDTRIEQDKGVGQWTCYPNQWYAVIESIPLADYGNAPPTVTFENFYEEVSLPAIITEVCGWRGLTPADLDLSELDGITISPAAVAIENQAGNNISGVIRSNLGFPLGNIEVGLKSAGVVVQSTTTYPSSGEFLFTDVPAGDYTIQPYFNGLGFSPAERAITVPPGAGNLNFTAFVGTSAPLADPPEPVPASAPATASAGEGYVADTRKPAHEVLSPLMLLHSFVLVEEDGMLRAKRRGRESAFALDEAAQRVHSGTGEMEIPEATQTNADADSVTSVYELQFMDVDRRMHPGYRYGRRYVQPGREGRERRENVTVPATMAGARAEQIAQLKAHEAVLRAEKYKIAWGLKYLYAGCADEITIATPEGDKQVYLPEITRPLFGPISAVAPRCDPLLYGAPRPVATIAPKPPQPSLLGTLHTRLFETHTHNDNGLSKVHFYTVAAVRKNERWAPVSLVPQTLGVHASNSSNPTGYPVIAQPGTFGTAQSTLGDHAGGSGEWDDVNTLTVELLRGELESVTDADILTMPVNALLVGSEIIQFRDALFVEALEDGSQVYTVSRFLRGRRGTEWAIGSHVAAEDVTLLDSAVVRVDVNLSALDNETDWEWQRGGAVLLSDTITITGRSIKPFSVGGYSYERDGSDNLSVTFWPRSRYTDLWMQGVAPAPPLTAYPDRDDYEIDVYDGVNVVRTIAASGSGPSISFEYSAAEQTTDFGSAQSSITMKMRRLGQIATSVSPSGRGYEKEITI